MSSSLVSVSSVVGVETSVLPDESNKRTTCQADIFIFSFDDHTTLRLVWRNGFGPFQHIRFGDSGFPADASTYKIWWQRLLRKHPPKDDVEHPVDGRVHYK